MRRLSSNGSQKLDQLLQQSMPVVSLEATAVEFSMPEIVATRVRIHHAGLFGEIFK